MNGFWVVGSLEFFSVVKYIEMVLLNASIVWKSSTFSVTPSPLFMTFYYAKLIFEMLAPGLLTI
jgi:hypothetical protein